MYTTLQDKNLIKTRLKKNSNLLDTLVKEAGKLRSTHTVDKNFINTI